MNDKELIESVGNIKDEYDLRKQLVKAMYDKYQMTKDINQPQTKDSNKNAVVRTDKRTSTFK